MQSPRIRPQYELFVDVSAAETLRLVETRIEASTAIRGWVAEPYAELRLPEHERTEGVGRVTPSKRDDA